MKLYTKSGDEGMTSLVGGERVSKDDARVEAYGTVDELSAHLGLLGDFMGDTYPVITAQIAEIQRDLTTVMGGLAGGKCEVADTLNLEKWIDAMEVKFTGFVTPGGGLSISQAHVCRTVCRRAERRAIAAGGVAEVLQYLNRLSDWCFAVSNYFSKFAAK